MLVFRLCLHLLCAYIFSVFRLCLLFSLCIYLHCVSLCNIMYIVSVLRLLYLVVLCDVYVFRLCPIAPIQMLSIII